MTTLDALLDAVMTLISTPSVVPILQLNSNTKERAFEAYVFCLAVAAVRRATGEVEVHGATSGVNPSTIVFRGGPGNMGSTAQDFCYAKCTLGRKTFEIHVDVTYIGTSGAAHEIDVSLYDAVAADAVRRTPNMQPSARALRCAFECKFYDSKLGTALGRAFQGLVADCGSLASKNFVTNGQSEQLARYFSAKGRPDVYFHVSPILDAHAERLISNLEQALRKWAAIP